MFNLRFNSRLARRVISWELFHRATGAAGHTPRENDAMIKIHFLESRYDLLPPFLFLFLSLFPSSRRETRSIAVYMCFSRDARALAST